MYALTLTESQRMAFDWVGNRYASGEIADLLRDCMPPDAEWAQLGDVTFQIPECVAWEIAMLADTEDRTWPCFNDSLRDKMNAFIDQIV